MVGVSNRAAPRPGTVRFSVPQQADLLPGAIAPEGFASAAAGDISLACPHTGVRWCEEVAAPVPPLGSALELCVLFLLVA